MISLIMLCYIGVYAQTEPEVILLGNDVAEINYYDENGYLLQSQIIENYSQSQNINFEGDTPVADFGDETLLDVVSFPDPQKGIIPREYCYNPINHKYYIFGGNKVLVYNSLNNELITDINISESMDLIFWSYPKIKSMVYSENSNKIYCTTPDNTMVVINGVTDQKETSYDLGTYYQKLYRNIYYDKFNDNIFVTLVVYSGDDPSFSKILKFSNAGTLISEQNYNFIIRDLESVAINKLFVSTLTGIYKIDPNNLNNTSFIKNGNFSDIVFAENENKIFACDAISTSIFVVDILTEQNISTIENDLKYVYDATYNPINKKVYLVGKNTDQIQVLLTLDSENDLEIQNSGVHTPKGVLWVDYGSNNRVYIKGFDNIFYSYGNTNSLNTSLDQYIGLGREMGYNPDLNQILSLNTSKSFFTIQDLDLTSILSTEHTGGWCVKTAYNTTNNKIYITDNKQHDEITRIGIYNGTDYSLVSEFEIGFYPKNIHYTKINNKVYVLKGDGYLDIIDGTNDSKETVYSGSINPTSLLESNYNYLVSGHSGAQAHLSSFNLQNNSRTDLHLSTGAPFNLVWGVAGDAYLNNGSQDDGMHLTKVHIPSNEIWSIEKDQNEFMVFSPIDTTVFVQINDQIAKVDGMTGEIINSIDLSSFSIIDAAYYPKDNSMILLGKKGNSGYFLWKINCDDLSTVQNLKQIPTGKYNRLFLNNVNDRLYCYLTIEGSDLKTKLLSFNPSTFNLLASTSLGPKKALNDRGPIFYSRKLGISINPSTNQLILPNWIYSNFSIVQCPEEERSFKKGWNWVSFPKLQRTDDDAVDLAPVLNTLEPMPENMLVQHRLNTIGNPMTWAMYDEEEDWTFNDLDDLQSTKGYKIEMDDNMEDQFQLVTPGTRLDSEYPIALEGNMKENWIGYYEYQTADPFDALAFCIDNLRVIKGQYWSAYYEVIAIDKGAPVYGWIMSRPRPLKYGDMLVVQGINDCELTWNRWPKTIGKEKAEASYFEFEEQADYTSVFIELDENTQADEIGAFVGESCVGATVVEENDTLVEIRAYLQGAEGDEMNFVTYTGNKSSNATPQDYFIRDFEHMQYVNRKIRPYDKKPFHMISFKDKSAEITEDTWVYHFPNPVYNELNIQFKLADEENVSLELLDIHGKVVDRLNLGHYDKGLHQYHYQIPTHLSAGVYFYKFQTKETTIVNQLILQN